MSEHTVHPIPAEVLPPAQKHAVRAQLVEGADDEQIYTELPSVEAARWRALLLVLCVAALIPFVPALFNGWVLQDDLNIKLNTIIQAWPGFKLVWRLPHHFPQFSPIGYSAYMLEIWAFKLNPAGFHATNILLHLINVLLLWTLLRKLELPGSWLATLIYAVHPITMSTVAWVSRQPTLLGTTFMLTSLIVYCRYCGLNPQPQDLARMLRLPERPWARYALSLVLLVLAILTYPLTAIFPLVVLVLIWWERGEITRRDFTSLIPHLVLMLTVLVGAIVLMVKFGGIATDPLASPIHLSPLDRVLIGARALWFYLYKILLPVNLSFAYPTWQIGVVWPVIFVVLLLAVLGAMFVFRRRLSRGAIATTLLFLIATIPVATFIDPLALRSSFVADQLVYVAAMVLIVPIVSVLAERFIPKTFSPASAQPGPYVAIVLFLLLGALSVKLALAYKDQDHLWADTIDKYPETVIAQNGMGIMAMQGDHPDIPEAAEHFRKALSIDRTNIVAMLHLGQAYADMGDWDRALGQFTMAQAARPDSPQVYAGLADLYFQRGYSAEAITEYEKALKLDPRNDQIWISLGRVYERRGETDKAIEEYREAIKVNPRSILAHNYLAVQLYAKGKVLLEEKKYDELKKVYEEVAKELQIAHSIDQDYFPVYMSSGAILFNMGAFDKAEMAYKNAVFLSPSNVEARTSLAMAEIRLKRLKDAKMHLTAALQMDPQNARAHYLMGVALSMENDIDGALPHLQQAVDLDSQQHDGAVDPTYLRTLRDVEQKKH